MSSLISFPSQIEKSCENWITNNIQISDIEIKGKIADGKFPLYLATSLHSGKYYAMKVFPYVNGSANQCFLNEIKFSQLNHSKIISPVGFQPMIETDCGDDMSKASFTLTEWAPHKDLFNAIVNFKVQFDEVLARTYFHQLIEGLEYLHSQSIAHMDIKPENLVLGEDFTLKIIDFDLSHFADGTTPKTRGTPNFRAPELIWNTCRAGESTDIFSAAIVLFLMMTNGTLPQFENTETFGENLLDLLLNDPESFWQKHSEIKGEETDNWNEDFKELFIWMTRENSEDRASIQDIKNSKWYQGATYSNEEVCRIMSEYYYD
jgi:serine/threonine protein kinase